MGARAIIGIFSAFFFILLLICGLASLFFANAYIYGPTLGTTEAYREHIHALVIHEDVGIRNMELPWEMKDLIDIKIRINQESTKTISYALVPTIEANIFLENASYIEFLSPFNQTFIFHAAASRGIVNDSLGDPLMLNAANTSKYLEVYEWTPQEGQFSVIIFNTDLSKGIEGSFQIGAKYYFLEPIGYVLIVVGAIFTITSFKFATSGQSKHQKKKAKRKKEVVAANNGTPSAKEEIRARPSPPKPKRTFPQFKTNPRVQQKMSGDRLILCGSILILVSFVFSIISGTLMPFALGFPFGIACIVRGDQRNWDLRKRQDKILGSVNGQKEERPEWIIVLDDLRTTFYGESEYYSSLDPSFDRVKLLLIGGGIAWFGFCMELDFTRGPGFLFIVAGVIVIGYTFFRQNELKKECQIIQRAINRMNNPTLSEISHIIGKPEAYVYKRIEHMKSTGELQIKFDPQSGSIHQVSGPVIPTPKKAENVSTPTLTSSPSDNKRDFCDFCGRLSPDESLFCSSCGMKFDR